MSFVVGRSVSKPRKT